MPPAIEGCVLARELDDDKDAQDNADGLINLATTTTATAIPTSTSLTIWLPAITVVLVNLANLTTRTVPMTTKTSP